MEKTALKDLNSSLETWAIIVKVIRQWQVHRKAPPFTPWKLSLMLMDEEVFL